MANTIDKKLWLSLEQLENTVKQTIDLDREEITAGTGKSFRRFLVEREQSRMPFLQRVMTSHLENMEDDRGFPPRHPVHWFRSQLEFSSTGILNFNSSKEAEEFVRSALNYIEIEVKESLNIKQQELIEVIDTGIGELKQIAIEIIEPIARERKIIATEYVNSSINTRGFEPKILDRFYFVDNGTRFDRQRSTLHMEVCKRGGFSLGLGSKEKIEYAVACDRLVDIANESIARSLELLKRQSLAYLSTELSPQLTKLETSIDT
jgi:hypothetical protein